MTDKPIKVSLRMVFTMSSSSNAKPLYEGFIVKINCRDWTLNIERPGTKLLISPVRSSVKLLARLGRLKRMGHHRGILTPEGGR